MEGPEKHGFLNVNVLPHFQDHGSLRAAPASIFSSSSHPLLSPLPQSRASFRQGENRYKNGNLSNSPSKGEFQGSVFLIKAKEIRYLPCLSSKRAEAPEGRLFAHGFIFYWNHGTTRSSFQYASMLPALNDQRSSLSRRLLFIELTMLAGGWRLLGKDVSFNVQLAATSGKRTLKLIIAARTPFHLKSSMSHNLGNSPTPTSHLLANQAKCVPYPTRWEGTHSNWRP